MRLHAKKLIAKMLAADSREKPPSDPGVYAIVNRTNERAYIGSAMNVRKRLGEHRSQLRLGKHSNELLQADWLEHGADAFVFGVLLLCHKWDRVIIEQKLTAQVVGPACYAWGIAGQKSKFTGHPAIPGSGVNVREHGERKMAEIAARRVSAKFPRHSETDG